MTFQESVFPNSTLSHENIKEHMRHHKIGSCISGLSPDVESEENLLPLSVCVVKWRIS